MSSPPLSIAVIGCGAIAETFYLPALKRLPAGAARVVLVDPDPTRLAELKPRLPDSRTASDFRQVLSEIEAVILATPPDSHYSIGKACLEAGAHVLCEKPLALAGAEARELVDLAARKGVVLGVNNTRRLFASSIHVRDQIESGALGRVRAIRYYEGQPFEWPTVSGFYFRSGKGVLLDRGSHVLDLICWWLGDLPRLTSSLNDSFGGPEAVAHLDLEHQGCRVDIRLSWLYKQANRFAVEGDEGRLEGEIYDWRAVDWTAKNGRARGRKLASEASVFTDYGHLVTRNFLAAIAGREEILVPGSAVVPSIGLIEECYERASRFAVPWLEPRAPSDVG